MLPSIGDSIVLVHHRYTYTHENRPWDKWRESKWQIFVALISDRHGRLVGWRNVKTKSSFDDVFINNASMVWSVSKAAASKTAAEMYKTKMAECSSYSLGRRYLGLAIWTHLFVYGIMKAMHVIWHLNSLSLQRDGNLVIRVWLSFEGKILFWDTMRPL